MNLPENTETATTKAAVITGRREKYKSTKVNTIGLRENRKSEPKG
jgi:ABC-type phosphate transport system auxiliary subunit